VIDDFMALFSSFVGIGQLGARPQKVAKRFQWIVIMGWPAPLVAIW
jgi:hypothetical protein